ncbi:MAG: flagellar biosynthetic protein FliO [Tardiphaga sp.]
MQTPLTFFFAFVVVLALIGLAAWLVRRFAGNRLGANASRGRMPRLAVIDAAAVDGRRRLVLVRRDNVEHLLMIGGPTDIVVEPNIVRATPGRDQAPSRGNVGNELSMRNAPPSEAASWADNDSGPDTEPHLPEPPRPARPSFIDEPRRPVAPLPERRPDPVAAFTPEAPRAEPRPDARSEPVLRSEPAQVLPTRPMPRSETPRPEPMMPRPMRAEPPIRTTPPPRVERPIVAERPAPVQPTAPTPPAPTPAPAPAVSAADQNLADMAQRLEAALRRPVGESRPEAAEPRVGAPPVAPEPPPARQAPRITAEVSIAPSRSDSATAPIVAPPVKTGFENLEDEMASLLGRPKSSS